MSCTDDVPAVEREVLLPVPPAEVWESLPAVLGDDGELDPEPGGVLRSHGPDGDHVGVVEEVDAPYRLSFWWVPVDGDDAPSRVEIALEPAKVGDGVGTILHLRESQFDAAGVARELLRGPLARARN
jgi:uncharacterized protein YndB with AHSA1/START domain